MSNTYQMDRRCAQPDRPDGEVAVPEQVIVSMTEIAESAREGPLALAVGTCGFQNGAWVADLLGSP